LVPALDLQRQLIIQAGKSVTVKNIKFRMIQGSSSDVAVRQTAPRLGLLPV
jgi:hypothetical protein